MTGLREEYPGHNVIEENVLFKDLLGILLIIAGIMIIFIGFTFYALSSTNIPSNGTTIIIIPPFIIIQGGINPLFIIIIVILLLLLPFIVFYLFFKHATVYR